MKLLFAASLIAALLFGLSAAPFGELAECGACCAGKPESGCCGARGAGSEIGVPADGCCEVGPGAPGGAAEGVTFTPPVNTAVSRAHALFSFFASPFAGIIARRTPHERTPVYLLNSILLC